MPGLLRQDIPDVPIAGYPPISGEITIFYRLTASRRIQSVQYIYSLAPIAITCPLNFNKPMV